MPTDLAEGLSYKLPYLANDCGCQPRDVATEERDSNIYHVTDPDSYSTGTETGAIITVTAPSRPKVIALYQILTVVYQGLASLPQSRVSTVQYH